MQSTIENDLEVKEGVLTVVPKKLPDWYGIPNVGFIWRGYWSDPEIEHKGKRINSTIVEDTMWERWIYDDNGNLIPEREADNEGFKEFMKSNADEVYELIELVK